MGRTWVGFFAVFVALLGLACTLLAEYSFEPPPRPMITIEINGVPLFGKPKPLPREPMWSQRHLHLAGVALGGVAIALAVAAFLLRVKARWGVAAICVAIAAIAWNLVVIVLAATVFFLFFSGALFMGLFVPRGKESKAEVVSPK